MVPSRPSVCIPPGGPAVAISTRLKTSLWNRNPDTIKELLLNTVVLTVTCALPTDFYRFVGYQTFSHDPSLTSPVLRYYQRALALMGSQKTSAFSLRSWRMRVESLRHCLARSHRRSLH